MQNRKKRQKITGQMRLALCVACTAGLCFSASAGSVDSVGPTTNVWVSVVELSSEARISVMVPISYGFAVLGTNETNTTAADEEISYINGNLYLPHVRVEVTKPSSSGIAEFKLIGTPDTIIPLENYSTDVREKNLNQSDPKREGLPVELRPYIVDSGAAGHYWQISSGLPTSNSEDFKKYRMVLDGKPFSVESKRNIGGTLTPVVEISDNIALPAPPDTKANGQPNGHTAAGAAEEPSRTEVPVDVQIGGRRGQYHQVEQSVKVAQICWEVIPGELQ